MRTPTNSVKLPRKNGGFAGLTGVSVVGGVPWPLSGALGVPGKLTGTRSRAEEQTPPRTVEVSITEAFTGACPQKKGAHPK
jgi:hypothetical protein